jgi:hypothetical protein
MADSPETKIPHSPAAPAAGVAPAGTTAKPLGWQISEEEREEEQLYNDRADARERWEDRQYGWALFAVVVLLLAGGFQIVNGLIALFRSGTYQVGSSGLAIDVDYETWGWIHLGLGLLAVLAAFGLMRGHVWAGIVGVTLAALSAVAYLTFIPAFPALCLVVITLNLLVIFAIIVHGGDLKDAGH